MDVSDGDLVRLARAGDAAAFRLLVERHGPLARARASRLCSDPGDVDEVVQESFLQALVALGRLRDPERFVGWLCGIVLNVHRAMQRRPPVTLLADWPERLHPVSDDGLPSADELDRAQALRQAVAELPAAQRRAVEMYYYADLPTAQIAESPGAAKTALHKARRRLREHITAHRPDLIPTAARRTPMITVRIAHAVSRPGMQQAGTFRVDRFLVVLADDAGGRALPLWLPAMEGFSIHVLLDRPTGSAMLAPVPEELARRLLEAAGTTVTAVDIEELGPEVTAARVELDTPIGPQQVMARLADGLALAAAAGATVRVANPVMDRLAVRVHDDDLLEPFLQREPAAVEHHVPRRRPANLTFTEGMNRWQLSGDFQRDASGSHWEDYSCSVGDHTAILSSAVPRPYGSGRLSQLIRADDYRGSTLVFRGELRADNVAGQALTFVCVQTEEPGLSSAQHQSATVTGSGDWTGHEVSAPVPAGAVFVEFGVILTGRGRIELRNVSVNRRR